MASGIIDNLFPVGSLVPKSETGALNFLQKYPDFKGPVTIAILDSGVDPRATGLKKLPDGSVKVIERFDCTGCGDVDVSKKVTSTDGTIIGLSGRTLKLTEQMKNSNKDGTEYRIGLKSLYDLYPPKIREKASNENKVKNWDELHKTITADISRELHKFEQQNPDPQNLTFANKLKKEDYEQSLEFLNNYDKKFADIRTTYDVVLFQTEKGWYGVLDTSEEGDLEKGILIGEYSKTYEIKNLDNYLSISMNVQDNGNVMEIVGTCSSHGTHVASIASGNHADKELDGVAPNAKIVSLTIGDGRLGSMETGTALIRAMIKVMELCNNGIQIDVINMSYGEHAHWSNAGRLGELMHEVVCKYGVVWVASAGNHGPALCTIGTPPNISQPICVGVGAYVSPQMMEGEYTLREKLPANIFTWSSRDPCVDGGNCVTVCAPGAAITSVPSYTMSRAQLMNGTSMAAPHVAGAIALIISGLKHKDIQYSPFSIKRALTATATKMDNVDEFAQGSGLLNVERAFEHLVQYNKEPETMVRFAIKVGANAKGIHLRNGPLKKPAEYNVTVEPIFFNEKEVEPSEKIKFNIRLNLICSKPWVQCGAFLDLCHSSRQFCVKIDPVGLPPGVYTATVKGYDTARVEKGSLFEVPITVVQPHIIDVDKSKKFNSNGVLEFKPNTIQRDFILVPPNATWAVLKMSSVDPKQNQVGKFFIHTMQILPMTYCKGLETMKLLSIGPESESVYAFKVEQNVILELCVAKYWSNFGESHIRYSLEFHGVLTVSTNATTMIAANGIHRIDIFGLSSEDIAPTVQLKTGVVVLKPTDSTITPLSPYRDVIPPARQIYQHILTYNLQVQKAQEIAIYAPMLVSVLYESEFESQFWMLYDTNKMLIRCGDAYSDSTFVKIEKGEYQIRLQIRHEKKDLLEKMQDMNMLAVYKIQNLNLDIYDHYNQAIIGGKKFTNGSVTSTNKKPLFLAPITNERLNKVNLPPQCAWLNGIITYAKDEHGKKADTTTFHYVLMDTTHNKKNNGMVNNNNAISTSVSVTNNAVTVPATTNVNTTSGNDASVTPTATGANTNIGDASPKKVVKKKPDEYKELLRDFQCSQIPKVDFEIAEEIYKEVTKNQPTFLPVHLMLIQQLENVDSKIQLPFAFSKLMKSETKDLQKLDINKFIENLRRIIELSDTVINGTAKESLLAYYGIKNDTRIDAGKIKTTMDKQRSVLIEALVKKGIAVCKLIIIENLKINNRQTIELESTQKEQLDEIYSEIGKFIEMNDTKVISFAVWYSHMNSHFGRMCKYLQKMYEEKLSRDILEEMLMVTLEKKWNHVSNVIKKYIVSANPINYRPF